MTRDQRSSAVPAGRAPSGATREPGPRRTGRTGALPGDRERATPGDPAGRATSGACAPENSGRRACATAAGRRAISQRQREPGLARRLARARDRSPGRVPHPVPPARANPASPTVNPVPRTHSSLSVSSPATVSARGPWPLPSQSRTRGQPGWSAPRWNRQRAGSSVLNQQLGATSCRPCRMFNRLLWANTSLP